MSDRVWLVADAPSGEVAYVRHGHAGQEATWKIIGPFVYTKVEDAEAAVADRRFLPEGATGTFKVLETPAASFVQAIFNGFPPSATDVFAIDEGLFPVTEGGAQWVDEALGAPVWAPLFDQDGGGNGLAWLDVVLDQVAQRLGMSKDTIEAIGTISATDADVDDEVSRARKTIMENVRVAIVPEHDTVALQGEGAHEHELTGSARFWLHTVGLRRFNRPELEIRDVPAWWITAAGAELNGWAAYSLDHEIKAGERLQGGGPVPLQLRAVASPDPFWLDTACLRLEVARIFFHCQHDHHKGPTVH